MLKIKEEEEIVLHVRIPRKGHVRAQHKKGPSPTTQPPWHWDGIGSHGMNEFTQGVVLGRGEMKPKVGTPGSSADRRSATKAEKGNRREESGW